MLNKLRHQKTKLNHISLVSRWRPIKSLRPQRHETENRRSEIETSRKWSRDQSQDWDRSWDLHHWNLWLDSDLTKAVTQLNLTQRKFKRLGLNSDSRNMTRPQHWGAGIGGGTGCPGLTTIFSSGARLPHYFRDFSSFQQFWYKKEGTSGPTSQI